MSNSPKISSSLSPSWLGGPFWAISSSNNCRFRSSTSAIRPSIVSRVTNRVTGPLASHLPGFGVIVHTGRKSGRRYRTPVNVFSAPGGYVVALVYGPDSEWVKNVIAAGGCELETRGRREHLTEPAIFHDEERRRVPPPVRLPLRLFNVTDFMRLTTGDVPPG